ncbi:MAG: hypothetical protein WA152_04565 [Microgenomates group bacterium]
MKFSIRLLYLYLFSFIGLIIAVIGTIQLVDLGMKVYIFKDADKYDYPLATKFDPTGKEVELTDKEKEEQKAQQEKETTRNRQRQASNAIAMLLVGIPLYKYHWSILKKENK